MTAITAFIYVVCLSLLVGLATGFIVRKWGYSFKQYFVAGFFASCGILGIIFKIIMDYL